MIFKAKKIKLENILSIPRCPGWLFRNECGNHRENKPAVIWNDGDREYYFNGRFIKMLRVYKIESWK